MKYLLSYVFSYVCYAQVVNGQSVRQLLNFHFKPKLCTQLLLSHETQEQYRFCYEVGIEYADQTP